MIAEPLDSPRPSFSVKKVSRKEAVPFFKAHHYLAGVGNSAMIYGLFIDSNEMKGLIAYQTPCSEAVRSSVLGREYAANVTELSRLALADDCPISASAFVSASIKVLQSERRERDMTPLYALISFADMTQNHHGGVYQAMSWLYTGTSESNGAYKYIDEAGTTRHRRQNGVNIKPDEARARGWRVERQKRVIKHRYVKILGTPKQRRKAMRALQLQIFDYPKPSNADRNMTTTTTAPVAGIIRPLPDDQETRRAGSLVMVHIR